MLGYVAIGLATLATIGCVLTFLQILHRHRMGRFPGARLLPGAVAALVALPCFYFANVVGGTFGGGWAAQLSERTGSGGSSALILAGVGLGVWVVFTTLEILLVGVVGLVVLERATEGILRPS